MGNTVYLETSIISYLAARPSRDLVTAGHQQTTHDWWANERHGFQLCASALVLREASAGDPEAAAARRHWLHDIALLTITSEAERLSEALISQAALPVKAAADALHIATAAIHRVNYLLSWNCTHIANAIKRPHIERICRDLGFEPPVLCTPEELTRGNDYVG